MPDCCTNNGILIKSLSIKYVHMWVWNLEVCVMLSLVVGMVEGARGGWARRGHDDAACQFSVKNYQK